MQMKVQNHVNKVPTLLILYDYTFSIQQGLPSFSISDFQQVKRNSFYRLNNLKRSRLFLTNITVAVKRRKTPTCYLLTIYSLL